MTVINVQEHLGVKVCLRLHDTLPIDVFERGSVLLIVILFIYVKLLRRKLLIAYLAATSII